MHGLRKYQSLRKCNRLSGEAIKSLQCVAAHLGPLLLLDIYKVQQARSHWGCSGELWLCSERYKLVSAYLILGTEQDRPNMLCNKILQAFVSHLHHPTLTA